MAIAEVKKRKCIIYVRVSTEDQLVKGFSIPGQIEDCMKKAKKLGYEEAEVIIIQDDESGADINRPGLTQLRENIKNYSTSGISVDLIMYDPDRFARDLKDQLVVANELESLGAKLVFVNIDYNKDNPESVMFFQLRGMFAQYERTKIKQRTSMGRLIKVKKMGKMAWPLLTYGYHFNEDTDQLDIIEEQAEIIKLIFKWFVDGDENGVILSCSKIAKKLATMGIPTPKEGSKSWHASTISKIIKNEIYTGTYWAYKTKTVDGIKIPQPKENWIPISVPKIIDDSIYKKAQINIVNNYNKGRGKSPEYPYLLRRLLFCGRCGGNMVVSVSTHKTKTYRYYTCNNKMNNAFINGTGERKYCYGKVWDVDLIDNYVWNEIVKILSSPERFIYELMNIKEDDLEAISKEIKLITNELNKLNEKEEGLVKLYMSQRINLDTFDKMKLELDNKKYSLIEREKELNNIINQKKLEQEQRNDIVNLLQNINVALDNPDMINPHVKMKIIRQFIRRITLFDDGTVRIEGLINFDNLTHHVGDVVNWHKELQLSNETKSIEKQIWTLYQDKKLTYIEIGEKLGMTKGQVDYRIRKMKSG